MSDMNSMNRETKKQQLRRRVISGPNGGRPEEEEERDSEEVLKHAHRKVLRKRGRFLLFLLLLIGALFLGGYLYIRNYRYTQYTVGWEKQSNYKEGGFAEYINFGTNVLKYTQDGATYIDVDGNEVWVQSYEMKSPIAVANGDFVAIGDQQGNSIYICDRTGCQGVATTQLPILKISVSGKGIVVAVMENQTQNKINMFHKDGSSMEIDGVTLLDGEIGYPLDIALSPEGTQWLGSFVYLDRGILKTRVAFYNFSEMGKNMGNRLVSEFHDIYGTNMVPRVTFLDDIYSCAFADNSLSFFSSRNIMSPSLLIQVEIEEEIQSIFYSSEYVGVIVKLSSGEFDYRMDIYDKTGKKKFSEELDYDYESVDIDGENILLYNGDSCRVYNMWGILKYEGEFDFTVSKITNGKLPHSLIVSGPQGMKEIKLH